MPQSFKTTYSFWSLPVTETLTKLKANSTGLSTSEASTRLKSFGANILPSKHRLSYLTIFLAQFKSPLIFILMIAGIVTLFLKEYNDSLFIFIAVLVNSSLGFYQENKAENALGELKQYLKKKALVLRNNQPHPLDSSDVVPGDIIILSAGSRIPADARLISTNSLSVDEAILTGESLPVKKTIQPLPSKTILPARSNMVWGGTLVVGGSARAVVTSTGPLTEIGLLADLVKRSKDEATPLQKAIQEFTLKLSIILFAFTALLFGTGIYFGIPLFEMFLTSVAVAVSAIPEGLPIALTVILAISVERMAKRQGVVRKLLAAETLGSTTIVLTDKTGTLTEAQASLSKIIPFTGGRPAVRHLLKLAALNVSAFVSVTDTAESLLGRPLETSLLRGAYKRLTKKYITAGTTIIDQIPFNSKDKFSAILLKTKTGYQAIMLGAPDILLTRSNLSTDDQKQVINQINKLAYQGEKLVGLAIKNVSSPKLNRALFQDVDWQGLISFRDPVRPHVAKAIRKVARLGVKTVIVTGDHQGTAEAVAKQVGLKPDKGLVINGEELATMSDDQVKKQLDKYVIFARVTPLQKLRIAKIYQSADHIVAMTGDGINDAPALKTANIGIAVGSGTEVAKSAADLIILDDNFETIVSAIEEGRKAVSKIKKVIVYLLSDLVDELILIGGALLTGLAIPISALQILWVNFFSDSFPALGLAFENRLADLGSHPSSIKGGLLDKEMKFLIVVIGTLTSILLFASYYFLMKFNFDPVLVRSFIFASFGTYTLVLAFSVRSLKKSIFSYQGFWDNNFLNFGVGAGIILMILAIYLPFLQNLLDTVALPPVWVLGVIALSLINITAVEFGKWLYRQQ